MFVAERLLTTTRTMNRVAAPPSNPNNQNPVSYGSIFLVFSVLVVFLALSMHFYYQREYCEIEKRQLIPENENLKMENKEFKDQNLALNQEVVGLREEVTHSKYQLNLTVADLKLQHQEQLHRQRQEDQSQMEKHVQEMAKSHNVGNGDVQFYQLPN